MLSKGQNEYEGRSLFYCSCRRSDRYLTLHRKRNKKERMSFAQREARKNTNPSLSLQLRRSWRSTFFTPVLFRDSDRLLIYLNTCSQHKERQYRSVLARQYIANSTGASTLGALGALAATVCHAGSIASTFCLQSSRTNILPLEPLLSAHTPEKADDIRTRKLLRA